MNLKYPTYNVSIQIDGTDLITTEDDTVDAALRQILKFPLPVETIAQFKDHIPLPQSAVAKSTTGFNFSGLLDALLEDRPTAEIEQSFPKEASRTGMLFWEILEHAFYGDQSTI
jgi:hypothetical protein